MAAVSKQKLAMLSNEKLIELLRHTTEEASTANDLSLLREEIIKRNIGLVRSIALGFLNSGELLDDLVQAGYIGLLNAVTNFDLARNILFSTYASYLIKGEIRHYIRDKHTTIRIPQWIQALSRKVKEQEEAFFQEYGRPPTLAELAGRLEISEGQLIELLRGRKAMSYVSIDQERRRHDPNPALPTIEFLRPRDEDRNRELYMRISVAIEELAEIQRQVISGLFYHGKSQEQVGVELGISQRQVSRMKAQALKRVKGKLVGPEDGAV